MKKLDATQKAQVVSDFKNSCSVYRLLFVKAFSLASVIIFLSNISPVSASTQILNNISNNFSGGTNMLKAIPPAYIVGSKLYADSDFAFTGDEEKTLENLSPNIKLQTKAAFDIAFAGRERFKNGVDKFSGVNSSFTSENRQFAEIKAPAVIGEKQNNLSQGTDQHENTNNFSFMSGLSRGLARRDKEEDESDKTTALGAKSPTRRLSILNSNNETRILMGVTAGELSADSTEAVNGSQLYSLGTAVATSFGGEASYKDGKWVAPRFHFKGFNENGDITDTSYNDVSSAFTGVGNSFEKVKDQFANIKDEIGKEISTVQSDALLWNGTKGAFVAEHGEQGAKTNSKITSLANGDINSSSSDAVAGNQLHALGSSIAKTFGGQASYEGGKWVASTFHFKSFNENGDVTDTTYENVTAAFAGVGDSIANIKNEISKEISSEKSDSLNWSAKDNAFVAEHGKEGSKTNSKITSLANGSITKDSTDAVTGGQLYSMNNTLASYFGGGAKYENDQWTAPSFTLKMFGEDGKEGESQTYNNVGSAFAGIDTNFSNVNKHLNTVVNDFNEKLDNINKEIKGDSLLWSNEHDAFVATHGEKDHKIKFLAAGDVGQASTDAVNGSQLYALGNGVSKSLGGKASYEDGKWVAPTFSVKTFSEDGTEGTKEYGSVSDAFDGVNVAFTNFGNKITNQIKQELGNQVAEQIKSDALSWNDGEKAYDAGHGAEEARSNSKIMHLADGTVASGSADAVTGGQLYALGSGVSKSLGGKASYEDGKWVAPTFHFKGFNENGDITDTSYNDVSSAFIGVGNSFKKVKDQFANIKDEIGKEISTVQSDALLWNGTKGAFVAEHGKEGSKTNSKITSLANGSITKDSTDAVTGGQLYSMNNTLASYFGGGAKYENDQWTAPSFTLKMFGEDGKEGESQTYNNVGSAFAGIDTNFSNVNKHLNTVVNDFNEKLDNINKEIKGDSLLWSNEHDAFVATHGEKDHKIKFLAAGDVGQASTDAVNGSQLYALGNGVSKSLGGKASYEDGKWVAPTFSVKTFSEDGTEGTKEYGSVSDAFDGVNVAFTNFGNKITNQIKQELGNQVAEQIKSDALSWNDGEKAYDAGHGAEEARSNSKIMHLADGTVASGSADAVTGGQLYALGSGVSKSLGGKASYEDGKWVAPTFHFKGFNENGDITDTSYNDVSSAFIGVGNSFKKVKDQFANIKDEIGKEISTVQSDALLWNGTKGAFVAEHGKEGSKTNSKITSLANGSITKDSTDAVTGGQLYSMNNTLASYFGGGAKYENDQWTAPSFTLKMFGEDGKEGESQTYNNVGSAFAGIDTNFSNVNKHLNTVVNDFNEKLDNINKEIKGDSLLWSNEHDAFVATHGEKDHKIKFLAAGDVGQASTDAVNGSQLYALGNGVSKSLGGKASYEDGKWVAPTFSVKTFSEDGTEGTKEYGSVSDAFDGVNVAFTNFGNKITNQIKQELGNQVAEQIKSDALSWNDGEKAYDAGHGAEEARSNSKIMHLADGTVASGSADAVTGGQLYALGSGVSKSLGGKASYEDGKWVAPTFHFKGFNENGDITDTSYNDVSSAFIGVGNSFKKVKDQFANIKDEIGKEISTVQSDALLWNGTKGAFVAEHGKEGSKTNSKITSLANGSITKDSTDAVTGGQLYSMNNTLASYFGGGAKYENDQWTAPSFTLKMFGEDGKEGESQTYNNVGSAFAGIDTNFSNVNKHLNTVVNDFNEKLDNINKEIKGDSLLWSNEHDAFVATHGEKDHKIKFLAAGDVGQASTDAVNGSQLYALGNGVSKSLGGKASYEDGKWVAPTFSVKTFSEDGTEGTKEYGSVSDAFDGVNVAFTNFGNKITNQIKQELGNQVAEQIKSDALSWNDGEKAYDAGHGAEEARSNSKIMHLADGTVASGSADAVTGGQLYALGSGVSKSLGGKASYEDGKWVAPTFHFKGFNENGDITDTSYNDVSSAFIGVGNSFKKVKDQFANIKDEIGKEISTVQSDALLWNGTKGAFVAEHGKEGSKTNSKITSLANGSITKDSTDAVNGSQLYALGNGVSKSLGGKASYEDGKWVAPTFHFKGFNENGDITDTSYNDVSSAFTGVGNSFKKVKDQFANIKDEIGKEISTVQSDALLWNGTKGAFVAEHGKEGSKTNSKITSLANGSITKDSTDAVTGGQLYALGNGVSKSLGGKASYEDGKWVAPTFHFKGFNENGDITDTSYNDVSSAFTGVGNSFKKVKDQFANIKDEIGKEISTVQSDALLWNGTKGAFVAEHGKEGSKTNSKITSLANGSITKDSTDAVNGSQLYALGNGVSKSLGGKASYEDGKWVAPTFHFKGFNENGDITDTSYNDVSSAFTGVGNSFKKVKDQFANIKDEIGKEISTVQSDALLWNGTKGAFVAEHGKEGSKTNSKITSLANGSITKDSTDAVTGGQLYSMNNTLASYFGGGAKYENDQWTAPSFTLKMFGEDGKEGESQSYNNVGSAFAGIDTNFSNVNKHLNTVVNDFNEKLDNINKEIKGDSLLWSNEHDAFVATHGKKDSKIKFLAAGDVGQASTDAVNGSQLYALGNGVSKSLGGKASYEDGKWVAPTFHFKGFNENGDITDTSYNDVSSAFTGVGNSFKKVKDQFANIKDEIGKEISTVQSDALLWNGTKGAFVAEHGKEGSKTNSKITSLANGSITKASTDAVTGGQLYSMNNTLASYFGGGAKYENDQWTAPSFTLKMFGEDGKEGESQSYNNVGSAFAGIDTNFSNVNKHLNTVVNDFNEKLDNINKEIKGDSLLWSNEHDAFVATHGKKDSKIKFLAAGDVGQASTDAVNGSQLYALGNGVSKSLGGKASYEDGKWVAPTFHFKGFNENGDITDTSYNDVSSAFTGVGNSFKKVKDQFANIKDEIGKEISTVQSDALLWNGTKGAFVAEHGKEGSKTNSKITSLANGSITKASTDAVTGGQLYSMNNTLASYFGGGAKYENDQWTAPSFTLKMFGEDGKEGESQSYNNVGSAFAGIDTNFSNVNKHLNTVVNDFNEKLDNINKEIKGDSLLWSNEHDAFVATHGKKDSKIKFLAAGDVGQASTDAVNGSQLYALGNGVSKSLGGKASYEDGKWVAPTFHFKGFNENGDITDTSYNDVSSAFIGVGNSFKKVKDQFANIKDEIGKEISTVQSDALLWNGTKGAFVAEHGEQGAKTNSKITSLANGSITKASTDAVTGGQLYSMNNTLASYFGGGAKYENDQWTAPSFTLKMFGEDGKEGESQTYNNVGSAFAGIDTNFSNVNKHLNTVVNDFNEKLDNINKEIKGDSLLWSNEHDAFVATHGKKDSKIKFLAAGDVGQASTDAVNGSQLYALGNGVSKALGGDASYKDGKWVAPTFHFKGFNENGDITDTSYNDVSSAFIGVGNSFKKVKDQFANIKDEIGKEISTVQSDALLWNGTKGAFVAEHGEQGAKTNSKITSLANGSITKDSTDAVTGGQLYSMNNTLASYFGGGAKYENDQWTAPSFTLKMFGEDGKEGESQTYNNVGSAFAGIDTNFSNVNKHLNTVVNDFNEKLDNINKEIKGDSLLWSNEHDAFVATHGKKDSKIKFLAAGDVGQASTDAVNGSQLYALGNGVSKSLGGKASYEDGKWVAPTFHFKGFNENGDITDTSYNDVSSAFTGVGNSFKKVKDQFANIKDEIGKEISTVQSDALLWNGTKGAFVAEHGKEGSKTNSKITSLANGSITKDSTDAVTGGQLYSMNNTLASYFGGGAKYENDQWTAPSFTLKMFGEDGKEGESQSYNNVGSAFAGIDTNFSNVNKHLNTVVNDFNEKLDNINKEIKGDSLLWSNEHDAFVATHGKKDSKIKFLAAGDVGQASTDAVNGSQLYALGNGVSKSLGGKASYEDGKWVAPTFHFKGFNENGDITDTSYNDVSSAFTGVGNSFKKVKDQFANIKDEIGKEISTVQSDALLWNGTKGAFVAEHGKEGSKTNSKITSLANGSITKASTDAVTGGQLYSMNNTLASYFGGGAKYENDQWTAPSFTLKMFGEDGKEGESQTYNNVGSAFAGIDTNFSNVNKHLNTVVNDFNEKLDNINKEIKGDSLLWSNEHDAFVATHGEKDSKIKFLAAGDVGQASTDAVNGSQLYALGNGVSKALGGDASYKDGKWVAPTFHFKGFNENGDITDTSYNDVSSAFTGVGNSFKKVKDQFANIKDEIGKEISTVQSDALLWDGTKGAFVAEHGKEGSKTNSKITSLANGSITKDSTDAVTGGQLYALGNGVSKSLGGKASYEDGKWVAPTFSVKTFSEDGTEGTKEYGSVSDAFDGVNVAFTSFGNKITNQIKQELGNQITEQIKSDALSWNDGEKAYDAGHGAEGARSNSKIMHLADGTVASGSADAVTGGQLYALGSGVSKTLGGDASYKDGKWVAPTFHFKGFNENGDITDTSYNDVSSAFTGVGNSFEKVKDQFANIKDEIGKEISTVQSDALLWDGTKGAFVAEHGKEGSKTNSKITSLANGSITKDSTDAVTGGQLYALGNGVSKSLGGKASYEDGKWVAPTFHFKGFNENGDITDTSYNDVSSAFTGVGNSFEKVKDQFANIKDEIGKEISTVQSDALLWNGTKGAFVAEHGKEGSKTNSKITSLANGSITKDSTDAVTGGQLYSMNNTLASYFGGGAKYENDQWTAPSFKVNTVSADGGKIEEQSYDNVAKAFASVGTSFTNLHNEVTNAVTDINNHINNVVSDSLVKQDEESKVIKIGAEKGGSSINISNSGDAARTLTGVKSGGLTETSTDAVNGSQLYSMNNTLASYFGGGAEYKEGKWVAPSFKVNVVNANGDKVEEQSYKTVAEAFAGVGSSFTNIHNEVTNAVTDINNHINNVVSDSLVKQDKKTHVISVGGEKSGTEVTFSNTDGASRTLTGVKAGGLTETSTDAVNGSQLFATNQNVTAVTNDLKTVSENTSKFLGGGADVLKGIAPTYTVQDKSYQSVADAFGGVDRSFTALHEEIAKNTSDLSDTLKQNALLWSDKDHAFVAIHGTDADKKNSKITLLANGSITKDSTDAINGSQLYSMNNTLATYFGGGAEYKEGKWVAPSFKVNTVSADGGKVEEQSYDNVAAAFAGVGSSFTNLHNELKNEISQVVKDSLVKQDEESKVIKIGAEKEGTEITIANSDGAERSLSGVKAGTLSADSTEAVNGGQLYSLNQTLASYFGGGAEFENGQWVAPSFTILSFNEDGSSEETSYNSVSAAFAGVNRSFMKLHHELSDTVEQNALLWSDADESFVALHGKGSEKHNSKLSHLVDGDISAGSTEAITGNQLYQLNQTLAAYLGGGASYQGGEWTAPHFEVKQFKSDGSSSESKSYDNVAGAFEGVNGSLSGINDRLNDVSKNVSTNSLKWNDELEGYDGRHNGSDSKITHVADGDVSEGSKEVVNGGQLWETNQKVSAVENRVESLDQHVKDVESAVTNGAVNYDKDDAGHKTNKVTLVGGDDSAPVLIDNLAEGRIESGSKEAVTGGQLHDYTDKQMKLVLEDAKKYTDEHVTDIVNNGVSESKAYTDMKFETLNYAIEDVRKEARQAAAIGLAVSNLRYYDIPGSLSVSFGSGLWRSQSAFAIGAGYTSEDGNIRSNVSITSAGGHWGIGAGITLRLR
ncbi:Vomp family autotransporter [Bartonella krasnovii]|nr:Vomp family autotransporter [Bartonella krasnovii]